MARDKSRLCLQNYPQCGSDAVSSARETSIRYVATRNDAAHFGKELYALATNVASTKKLLIRKRLCFLMMVLRGFGT